MLIKEYRIPLPMSVEEYRIAQLYMIQKKSREETCGEGSGVEILENRPYIDGPGGDGQYTHKVYHIGMHIPSWFRSILPKAALRVEEESWNAYPYTRTRYTCPFVEKFSIDIETYYISDSGEQPNVFNLSPAEKRQTVLDPIDIVKDPVPPHEYKPEEDPKVFKSAKTARGPLPEDWIQEQKNNPGIYPVMCAYKLCKVEFRYWGMQSKIERFIHDVGLRKVMVRAHRQAWCWQDEWYGLTIEDIRQLEKEAQLMLAKKMAQFSINEPDLEPHLPQDPLKNERNLESKAIPPSTEGVDAASNIDESLPGRVLTKQWSTSSKSSSKRGGELGPKAASPSHHTIADWRMQSIARDSDESTDEEFFDAHEDISENEEVFPKEITKWSSNDLMDKIETAETDEVPGSLFREQMEDEAAPPLAQPSQIHVLLLVLHGGNILDTGSGEPSSKQGDVNTIATAFDTVIRVHYPATLGRIAIKLVPCPAICSEAFSLVSNLSPYSYDEGCLCSSQDHIPLAALPLLATSSPQYQEAVATVILRANQVYSDFIRSQEGASFNGQVCLIGDCVGGILAFDALCYSNQTMTESQNSSRRGSVISVQVRNLSSWFWTERNQARLMRNPGPSKPRLGTSGLHSSALKNFPGSRRSSGSTQLDGGNLGKFEFEITDFFLFGCPLGLVLALRKTIIPTLDIFQLRPACQQVYNLFHPADPSASRLEPLLEKKFHILPPFNIPRYQRFPLGDGNSALLADVVQSHGGVLVENTSPSAPVSMEGCFAETQRDFFLLSVAAKWWGTKRIDYALYCPDALTAFPTVALPHLFHASYWESTDVVSFLLRQVMRHENGSILEVDGKEISVFTPSKPREKWLRKRTHVKLRNVTANHRINDTIANEERPQVLNGRFMYGPLDMVTLTGEKVDIHIMTQPPSGEWVYFDTEIANSSGRVSYMIPEQRRLGIGVYPVKMVVRGDHTYADSYITVLPRGTEFVVFSIDGSFAASVSIMGSDPKVRAGAVDVVRHWQELGYLIIYVTGRPDMQKQRVVAWLAQHNFPHGIVSFCDGLVHDPLRHKANFLKSLVTDIHAAYGSTKDVSVYTSINLSPSQIYIVGRPTKKLQNQCQFITEGYASHLAQLEYTHRSRPAKNTTRMALRKGSFGLPGQTEFLRKRNHLLRTISSQPTVSSGQSASYRPEWTQSHSESDRERDRERSQRSMSLATGCWGRSTLPRLEPGNLGQK
uniref:Phosphatidylinositol transfer protein membrane associated 2 n=1 Tax=Pseudonaja textilis TaxID=8673 RepID=A0A670YTK7_PSETE